MKRDHSLQVSLLVIALLLLQSLLPRDLSSAKTANASQVASARVSPAAEFVVTTQADNGDGQNPIPGSLREAIIRANMSPDKDGIVFRIGGDLGTPRVISLSSALPEIIHPICIDGETQPGFTDKPIIWLDGSRAFAEAGLEIKGGDSLVRGLIVTRFRAGIRLEGRGSNLIEKNFIGTDREGSPELGNGDLGGIAVLSSFNKILNNVVSNNAGAGIEILGSGNRVEGNKIGTDCTGTKRVGRGNTDGVVIGSRIGSDEISGNVIRDSTISGNVENGVAIRGRNTFGNELTGNKIGTDMTGTVTDPDGDPNSNDELGNGVSGVRIEWGARNNTVGGTLPDAGNLISGNKNSGVSLREGANNNRVQGNRIGTDITGTKALPNLFSGVSVDERSDDNLIGGADRGAGNLISGNLGRGVSIGSNLSTGNQVQGNKIGVDSTGAKKLGNTADGVHIEGASGNTIGGAVPGAGNVIGGNINGVSIINSNNTTVQANWLGLNPLGDDLGNMNAGLEIAGDSSGNKIGGDSPLSINYFGFNMVADINALSGTQQNLFLFNEFNNPLSVPINLMGDANGSQPAPQITSAAASSNETIIQGSLNSAPNQQFLVQLYYSLPSGAGGKPLGGLTLMTNPAGSAAFNARVPTPLAGGAGISAVATNTATNNTSRFSLPATVEGPQARPDLEVKKTGPETARCNDEITYTITVRNAGQAAAIGASVVEVLSKCLVLVDPGIASSQGTSAPFPDQATQITQLGRIDPGNTATITIKARLTEDCLQTIRNVATAFVPGDANDSNDAAMVDTRVVCAKITGISMQGKHVVVTGTGFQKGDRVEINGSSVNKTKFKGDDQLLAKKGKNLLMNCDPSNRERMNSIVVRRNGEIVASSDSPTCPPGADTSTTIASSQNPATVGQPVTFTATVTRSDAASATPTGTVEFKDGDSLIGSATLTGSGQASLTTSNLTTGTHAITATYSGDSNFNPSTSFVLTQTVNATTNATTTVLASSPNPSLVGQPVAFIATVTAMTAGSGIPTGTVTFLNGTTLLGTRPLNANGQAGLTIASLGLGSHRITAEYEGDPNFAGSTSNVVTQIVNPPGQ